MKNKKTILISVLLTTVILLGVSIFSPYNFMHYISAENILKDRLLANEFQGHQVKSVEYRGDNTYLIRTNKKEFVAIQEYTSTMNYKWKVYEYKTETN